METIEKPIIQLLVSLFVGFFIVWGINSFDLTKIDFIEGMGGFFVAFFIYQLIENSKIKRGFTSYIDKKVERMRLIQDPYSELDHSTIKDFILMNNNAQKVFSIDRNKPDAWFFNDNYMSFLILQGKKIKDAQTGRSNYEAHRIFIWRKEYYNDSRYKQLVILNAYAGVNVYLIPLEYIEVKKSVFIQNLTVENVNSNVLTLAKDKLEWLIRSEEFLLTEDGGTLSGIGKELRENKVFSKPLDPQYSQVTKHFFNWLLKISTDKKGVIKSKVDFNGIQIDANWLGNVELTIENIIDEVMKL